MSGYYDGNNNNPTPPPFPPTLHRPSYASAAAGSHPPSNAHSREPSGTSNPSRSASRLIGGDWEDDPSISQLRGESHAAAPIMSRTAHEYGRRPGTSGNWSSEAIRHDGLGCAQHEDHPPFFTPSYLRPSRHVQRLRKAYEDHVADLRDLANRNPHRQLGLSTSPSMTSLNKTSVHRGVAQDVVERVPPPTAEEERLQPLPSRWSEDDKLSGMEILAEGGEVRFNGITKTQDDAAAVRSDYPMPRQVGIYYFEVTILSRAKEGLIGIGFSSPKANLNRLPGWEAESWAYHGDDGFVFACSASGKAYGPRFAAQDVIGCGINFRTGNAFFTKNGNYLGIAFTGIKTDTRLFPSVGMKKPGEHLRVNFGKTPFLFDIDRMVDQERESTLASIGKTSVSGLHPPDDESALIHNLIGQYLAHEGYVETAKAFMNDVQVRQQSLSDPTQSFRLTSEDDIHATQRQKIRRSILDGDIDRALKYSSSYYPHLFDQDRNRDIYFRLRCRKFVEVMRRHAELTNAAPSPATVTKDTTSTENNGPTTTTTTTDSLDEPDPETEDPTHTQMELDDQLHRETSRSLEPSGNPDDVDMDASQELPSKAPLMKADQMLSAAVKYGQELAAEWKGDSRPHIQKQLQEIFAVMAYPNLDASPISHLFDIAGRVQIAEDVNGAILVSLGKPSSAALEKLCAQTEALLDETASRTGGGAAFVNVCADFLQD